MTEQAPSTGLAREAPTEPALSVAQISKDVELFELAATWDTEAEPVLLEPSDYAFLRAPSDPKSRLRTTTPVWTRSLRTYVGVAHTSRTLRHDGGELTSYLQSRDTVEANQPDLTGGLAFEQRHETGLLLRVDVGYQAYHRRAAFTGPIIRETTLREVIDPASNEVTRVDTLARAYRVRSTRQNRHQTIAFGLGAGYALPTASAWRPYVLAQAAYEVTVGTQGSVVDVDGREVKLDDGAAEWVNPLPGLRLGGTLGVDVAITPRWLIGLSGHYARTGDLTGADDPLSSRSQTFGVGLNASLKLR